jgi:hypothetical protein
MKLRHSHETVVIKIILVAITKVIIVMNFRAFTEIVNVFIIVQK